MTIEVMVNVLHHSKAQGRAKLVLLGIANHQGDQGAWPSIETLANYANASERSVMRDIQELELLGELVVERNAAPIRGQYRPNLYWVTVSPSGVTELRSGVTDSTSGVTDEVFRGDTVVTLNNIKQQETLKETNVHFEELFNEFWDAYPRKSGKGAARKALWNALEVADGDGTSIIDGAKRYASDPNRVPSFTKLPATWLNQECWDDEPLPERVLSADEKKKLELDELQVRREREAQLRDEQAERDRRDREAFEREREQNPVPKCEHGRIVYVCRVCGPNVVTDN